MHDIIATVQENDNAGKGYSRRSEKLVLGYLKWLAAVVEIGFDFLNQLVWFERFRDKIIGAQFHGPVGVIPLGGKDNHRQV